MARSRAEIEADQPEVITETQFPENKLLKQEQIITEVLLDELKRDRAAYYESLNALGAILDQLKIMNLHLQKITDEVYEPRDL